MSDECDKSRKTLQATFDDMAMERGCNRGKTAPQKANSADRQERKSPEVENPKVLPSLWLLHL